MHTKSRSIETKEREKETVCAQTVVAKTTVLFMCIPIHTHIYTYIYICICTYILILKTQVRTYSINSMHVLVH